MYIRNESFFTLQKSSFSLVTLGTPETSHVGTHRQHKRRRGKHLMHGQRRPQPTAQPCGCTGTQEDAFPKHDGKQRRKTTLALRRMAVPRRNRGSESLSLDGRVGQNSLPTAHLDNPAADVDTLASIRHATADVQTQLCRLCHFVKWLTANSIEYGPLWGAPYARTRLARDSRALRGASRASRARFADESRPSRAARASGASRGFARLRAASRGFALLRAASRCFAHFAPCALRARAHFVPCAPFARLRPRFACFARLRAQRVLRLRAASRGFARLRAASRGFARLRVASRASRPLRARASRPAHASRLARASRGSALGALRFGFACFARASRGLRGLRAGFALLCAASSHAAGRGDPCCLELYDSMPLYAILSKCFFSELILHEAAYSELGVFTGPRLASLHMLVL